MTNHTTRRRRAPATARLIAAFIAGSLFLGAVALLPQLLVRLGPVWVFAAAFVLLAGWAWMALSDERKAGR